METILQKYEFRMIRLEETEQAAEIEQICFPPNEACSYEHHDDIFAGEVRHVALGDMAKHLHGGDDTCGVLARDAQFLVGMGADGYVDGVIILPDHLEGELSVIVADGSVQPIPCSRPAGRSS